MTENTIQQTLTPAEVRQALLAEIEASKQIIAELSDEQLEEVTGSLGLSTIRSTWGAFKGYRNEGVSFPQSVVGALKNGPAIADNLAEKGIKVTSKNAAERVRQAFHW